jgi:hypothetical protein
MPMTAKIVRGRKVTTRSSGTPVQDRGRIGRPRPGDDEMQL